MYRKLFRKSLLMAGLVAVLQNVEAKNSVISEPNRFLEHAQKSITVQDVIENYFKAVGGREKAAAVTTLTFHGTTETNGILMDVTNIFSKEGKHASMIKLNGNTFFKDVFNGKEGYIESPKNKETYTPEMIAESLKKKMIYPELYFTGKENVLEENFAGESCNVIEVGTTKHYYSKKSGLKVGKAVLKNGKTSIVSYSDYREVNGLRFPFRETMKNDVGGGLVITVNSVEINKASEQDFQ